MGNVTELPISSINVQDFIRRRKMMEALTPEVQAEPSYSEQYLQATQEYPKYEEYKPSRLRKVLGAIAGLSGEPGAQRAVTDAPFYQRAIPYQQRLGALKTGAEFEMGGAKASAENLKNIMLARQAEDRARLAAGQARALPGTYEEVVAGQERARRAGLGTKGYAYGKQGRLATVSPEGAIGAYDVAPPDVSAVEAATIRAGATTGAARIRAEAAIKAAKIRAKRAGAAKFMTPQQQKVANQVAAQNVKNLAGQTIMHNGIMVTVPENIDDYIEIDAYGAVQLKRPSHWFGEPTPNEIAEYDLAGELLDSEFAKTAGVIYGEEDEDEEEFIEE